MSDGDTWRTVQAVPALCRAGATMIWTRHHRPSDLTPQIRAWFASVGFGEIASGALETSALTSVGIHRLGHGAASGLPDGRLFTFLTTKRARSGQKRMGWTPFRGPGHYGDPGRRRSLPVPW